MLIDKLLIYYLKHGLKLRGVADNSIARPGRKPTTTTKLWIYPIYSLRNSIRFLVRFSGFDKPLNKFRILSVEPGDRGIIDLRVGRKMANFLLLYSVKGASGIPMGSDTENKVEDHDIGSRGRLVYFCFAIA